MGGKATQFIPRGMQRDLSASKFNPEFAFENYNIRITSRDHNTLFSITNEKGNEKITVNGKDTIEGVSIGYAVLNKQIVLFTTETGTDRIIKLTHNSTGNFDREDLFVGSLGFDPLFPIETLAIYENENIQKVYWIDGKNQPRVINIAADADERLDWNNNTFDFIQDLALEEDITIERNLVAAGSFTPGVIQYAFTYFNTYGQESNIFYQSALYYISYNNRGASPEDSVSNSFTITINNADTRFDFIRIYSIHRSSIDSVPTVKVVTEIPVTSEIVEYTDDDSTGSIEDPTVLLYVGGEDIIPNTMEQKDNTLFLGNYTINRPLVPEEIRTSIRDGIRWTRGPNRPELTPPRTGSYPYVNGLKTNSNIIKTFKRYEWYRLGLQFQYKTGRWSEAVFIEDSRNTLYPWYDPSAASYQVALPEAYKIISADVIAVAKEAGFVKVRPVVVFPKVSERETIAQGILCPTVYNVGDRATNAPFVSSSWFARPELPIDFATTIGSNDWTGWGGFNNPNNSPMAMMQQEWVTLDGERIDNINKGTWSEFRHNKPIPDNNLRNSEIQSIANPSPTPYTLDTNSDLEEFIQNNKEYYYIDKSIVTFHSPDIEWDDTVRSIDQAQLKLRIVGWARLSANLIDVDIITSTPSKSSLYGFYEENMGTTNIDRMAVRGLNSAIFYIDKLANPSGDASGNPPGWNNSWGFVTYPWHRIGSLNNDSGDAATAKLESKKMSQLRFCYDTNYFSDINVWDAEYTLTEDDQVQRPNETATEFQTRYQAALLKANTHTGITPVSIYSSTEPNNILRIPEPANSGLGELNYSGNVDKIVPITRRGDNKDGYYIRIASGSTTEENTDPHQLFTARYTNINVYPDSGQYVQFTDTERGTEPSRLQYNSTTHAVFAFNYTKQSVPKQVVLPTFKPSTGGALSTMFGDMTNPSTSLSPTWMRPFWMETIPNNLDSNTIIDINYYSTSETAIGTPEFYSLWYNPSTDQLQRWGVTSGWSAVTINPDAIYAFKYNDYVDTIYLKYLPTPLGNRLIPIQEHPLIHQDKIDLGMIYGGYYIAELYNDNVINRFGGTTDEAIQNNLWLPAGEGKNLNDVSTTGTLELRWTEGDTYWMRYDHLKTYASNIENVNSIVDIVSFMVESRVNLDGRYDRNRGQSNNLVMTPQNFNLLNPVYSQKNNFFTYRALDYERYSLNRFPTSITWTREKVLGENIDTWTNITLAATLDMDGDKGVVRSLNRFNNEIYCFQDKSISQILFNSRTQLTTEQGIPIEIANSGRVDGKVYLSQVGCNNKWSIASSPSGLYFIDGLTNGIYLFNPQNGLQSLSDSLGFRTWMNNHVLNNQWDPVNFNNFRTHYDSSNDDVYFTNREDSLCYSELLGQFTSFMSYENVPFMFNVEGDFYSWKNNHIWTQNNGLYNMFYGEYKPFSITVIANEDMPVDKIYNTVEFRADSYDNDVFLPEETFDTLSVWNEYQENSIPLTFIHGNPSSLKRKFRIWRSNIPRDRGNRNRMRNPWLYVKLAKETPNTYRTELHDVIVHYFI